MYFFSGNMFIRAIIIKLSSHSAFGRKIIKVIKKGVSYYTSIP